MPSASLNWRTCARRYSFSSANDAGFLMTAPARAAAAAGCARESGVVCAPAARQGGVDALEQHDQVGHEARRNMQVIDAQPLDHGPRLAGKIRNDPLQREEIGARRAAPSSADWTASGLAFRGLVGG